MKIPLKDIQVKCSECGSEATAQEINDDIYRYHDNTGALVRFPQEGLTLEQVHKIPDMGLVCELCLED